MPSWILILVAISLTCSWCTFLYARKLAREDGKTDGAKPVWFGGILNYHLVASVLKEHSQRGDRWARRAYLLYNLGSAIIPVLIAALFIHQFWSR